MDAAANGNHNAVLYALNDGQQKVVNVKKPLATKEKKRKPQRQLFQQMG